ncbi:comF family protein [Lachnospiraceae bacterium NE2001]|nr:comF family protein [Lachnospiraceae bacterium NE2001]
MNKDRILTGETGEKFLDLLFPPRCALCDDVIPAGGGHICSDCRKKLIPIKEPTCYKCGKEVNSVETEYCKDCEKRKRSYVRGFPVFKYAPPLTDSLMAFKYAGKKEYAAFFADAIYERFSAEFLRLLPDAIVPVPINKHKLITRGYNQAELIAKLLGKRMNIQVRSDIIDRASDTKAQKELSPEERDRNLRNAFSVSLQVDIEVVLLVDDIYTTGSTIEACTRALHEAGVKSVYYTSVAIGTGN